MVRPSRRRRRRTTTTYASPRGLRETLRFNHLPQQLPKRQFTPPFLCCCRCFHLHIWFRCCTSRCSLPAASNPVRFGAETSGKNGQGATTVAAAAVQLVDENKSFCVCFLNCFFFLDYLAFLCRRTKHKKKKRAAELVKMKKSHGHAQCGLVLFLLLHSLLAPTSLAKKTQISGPVKTVVVLVMENRSFDHMLGWLKTLNPEIDGLTGTECNRLNTTITNSPLVCVSDIAEFVDPDPGHSFQAIREQIFGQNDTSQRPAPMNGFAQQAESMSEGFSKTVMSGFRPEVVPAYTALAMEYAVFDRWFASVPASTQPNRFYVHSATSFGAMSNVRNDLIAGFPQKTIFDSITDSGHSFGIYYQNIPATLFYHNLRKLKYVTKFHDYGLKFKQHARRGVLPNYVVVEQRYFDMNLLPANDDHPSHDVAQGQAFVKEVYEILRASPQWKEMLFVITYDEHGGFYDHVPTPADDVPNPDGLVGDAPYYFDFKRLGVRVPTIMISPWINKGTVVHAPQGPTPSSQYEHSSLPATIRKIFNLKDDFLTARDAWAGTFDHILSQRTSPRTDCPEKIPSSPWSLRHSPADEGAPLTEFQEELVQLASQLNGDHRHVKYPHLGKSMNVGQANAYVTDAVSRFLEAGRMAARSGQDPELMVDLKPSWVGRRAGIFNSKSYDSS